MSKQLASLITFSICLLLFAGCTNENKLPGKWEEVDSKMLVSSEFEFTEGDHYQYNSSYVQDTNSTDKYTVYKGTYKLKADTLYAYTEENPEKLLFKQPFHFQEDTKFPLGSTVFKKIK